jgi:hypothetical protein
MDYQKVYDSIIYRAKERDLEGYKESHHITPKCLGGTNEVENLVFLTGREHFICHWLLARIYPDNRKIAYAFFAMCKQRSPKQKGRYTPSSRVYQEARQHYSSLGFSEEHKAKIVSHRKGKKTLIHKYTKEIKYILPEELDYYIETGDWENTNYSKNRIVKESTKKLIAENTRKAQLGKVGLESKASKGVVICEYLDGSVVEAGSGFQLSKIIGVSPGTVSNRVNKEPEFIGNFKIYYKKDKI